MIPEPIQEQASLYALGCLEGPEKLEFESRLKQDAALQELVASLSDAAALCAGACAHVNPPPGLKSRILAELDSTENTLPFPATVPASRTDTWAFWLVGALAACLTVFSIMSARENALHSRLHQLEELSASLQSSTNELGKAIAKLEENNRLANLRVALLSSKIADDPQAAAVSLWDGRTQAGVIVVQNLKPLPQDADYQLWVVDPQYEHPVDGGCFQVDQEGNARIEFKTRQPVSMAKAFAITREIKGGVAVSKGPMLLIGK